MVYMLKPGHYHLYTYYDKLGHNYNKHIWQTTIAFDALILAENYDGSWSADKWWVSVSTHMFSIYYKYQLALFQLRSHLGHNGVQVFNFFVDKGCYVADGETKAMAEWLLYGVAAWLFFPLADVAGLRERGIQALSVVWGW